MERDLKGKFIKGHTPFKAMLGKKQTEEAVQKRREQMNEPRNIAISIENLKKATQANTGTHLSQERKNKIRESLKGQKHTAERIKNQREARINNPNRKFKDTSIELALESELQKRNIPYQKQVPLCKVAIVDFYLSQIKAIIQADGCYWHGCPEHNPNWTKSQIRDANQDSVLTSNGFQVYRFWEHDIKRSAEECINQVLR